MTSPTPLPVIFRAERSGPAKGEVTAVFPTLPGTHDPYTATCYAHCGQHGACRHGWPWYALTRPARPEEYADILAELRRIYEPALRHPDTDPDPVRLVVTQRWTKHHDAARKEALSR